MSWASTIQEPLILFWTIQNKTQVDLGTHIFLGPWGLLTLDFSNQTFLAFAFEFFWEPKVTNVPSSSTKVASNGRTCTCGFFYKIVFKILLIFWRFQSLPFVEPHLGLVHFFGFAGYLTRCHNPGSPRVTLWMAAKESSLPFEVAMGGWHLERRSVLPLEMSVFWQEGGIGAGIFWQREERGFGCYRGGVLWNRGFVRRYFGESILGLRGRDILEMRGGGGGGVSRLVTGGKTLDRKQRKIGRREGGGHLLVIYRGEYDFVVRGSKELRGKRFFSWRGSQRGVREEILATDERVTGSIRLGVAERHGEFLKIFCGELQRESRFPEE